MVDDAVDTAVAATSDAVDSLLAGSSVAHGDEEVDDHLLEEGRLGLLDPGQELAGDVGVS